MRSCLACAVSALAALAANAEWRAIEQVNEMDGTTTTSFIVRDVAPTRPLESYDGESAGYHGGNPDGTAVKMRAHTACV